MKAKDLEAGTEYLWSRTPKWASGTSYVRYGRVRVEDAQPVYTERNYTGGDPITTPVSPGHPLYPKATVRCVWLDKETGEEVYGDEPHYLRPADLRGPWAEASATLAQARKARQAEAHADMQARVAADGRSDDLRQRAADLGLTVQRKQGWRYGDKPSEYRYTYELTDAELERLLERLAATAAGRPAPATWGTKEEK